VFGRDGDHFRTVGGDDALVGDADVADAFPDPENERDSAEESKRLSGEAGGSQTGWDDGERPHFRRLNALSEETVTPVECRRAIPR
jgi:hypothetical protein